MYVSNALAPCMYGSMLSVMPYIVPPVVPCSVLPCSMLRMMHDALCQCVVPHILLALLQICNIYRCIVHVLRAIACNMLIECCLLVLQ